MNNLIQGVFIVVGIGFLMVGLRMALIMATSIPLVLISAIGTMVFFGVDLEQVSVAALIVSLGMLVDNAIEVTDNIHRYLLEGYEPFEASWRGASEISIPILCATLTTVAAFLPMLTIPAEMGEFVYSLPVVVSATLLISWFMAMTVTTVLSYWFIKPTAVQGGILAFVARCWIALVAIYSRIVHGQGDVIAFSKRLWSWIQGRGPIDTENTAHGVMKTRYGNLLNLCIKYRFITLGIGIALCMFSVILSYMVGDQFFPLAFRDQFMIEITLPAGSSLKRTDQVCRKVEDFVRQKAEILVAGRRISRLRNMASFLGGSPPRFYVTFDPQLNRHNIAQIIVNTTKAEYTERYIEDIRELINAHIAGARIIVKKLNLGTRTGAPVAIRVVGKNPRKMRGIARELKRLLYKQNEVLEVYDNWEYPIYQVDANVDKDLSNLAGISNRRVARTLNTFLDGQYLTTFREGDHQIPVFLRLPKSERNSLEPFRNFYVGGRFGRVPIDGISKLNIVWADSIIARRNLELTMRVDAYVKENALPNAIIERIMPQIKKLQRRVKETLPGYRIEIGGEWEDTISSQNDVNYAFNISFILIILILVWQYNGWMKPLLILCTLPMAFAGSMFGLFITGWPLNFMALLGLVSLSGIVLNDAIVLIDFIDTQLVSGQTPLDSILKACRMRMVPILLTSFTTAGGLIPLALWGGPMWEPMAYVIIFGLLNATFLTLILIPCVYYIFVHDLKMNMVSKKDHLQK